VHPFIVDLTRRERETARVPSKIVVDRQKDFYFLKTKTLVHWAPKLVLILRAITFLFNVPIVSTCNKQIVFGCDPFIYG